MSLNEKFLIPLNFEEVCVPLFNREIHRSKGHTRDFKSTKHQWSKPQQTPTN